jgi:hypothetical protein
MDEEYQRLDLDRPSNSFGRRKAPAPQDDIEDQYNDQEQRKSAPLKATFRNSGQAGAAPGDDAGGNKKFHAKELVEWRGGWG